MTYNATLSATFMDSAQ